MAPNDALFEEFCITENLRWCSWTGFGVLAVNTLDIG